MILLLVAELSGHTGGVYSVSWSQDSSKFISASVIIYIILIKGDQTVKLWDVETQKDVLYLYY